MQPPPELSRCSFSDHAYLLARLPSSSLGTLPLPLVLSLFPAPPEVSGFRLSAFCSLSPCTDFPVVHLSVGEPNPTLIKDLTQFAALFPRAAFSLLLSLV
jgi:hypothetical protein